PDPKKWAEIIRNEITEDCILVGHSLGVPAILRALEHYNGAPAKALFSVAGFAEKLNLDFDEHIDPFTTTPFRFKKIESKVENIFVWDSSNDPLVPSTCGDLLEKELNATRQTFKNQDHLSWFNNHPSFPPLLDAILKLK
ncbi:MAG: alpha/beta hydrolase, partial [Candidatus Peregrinibacteria bacterium]|nr:alpha/beta hydrolase [Candidatus Peregrinibacteria bacterium]